MTGLTIREFRTKVLEVQKRIQAEPQVELPLLHDFGPGIYLRRILMRKNTLVIGKTHKTEHFNIVLSGAASVMIDGEVQYIKAPYIFKSGKGIKKVLYIHEEMIWATIHPTEETDMAILEEEIVLTEEEEVLALEREIDTLYRRLDGTYIQLEVKE